jgi:hypothetical protein
MGNLGLGLQTSVRSSCSSSPLSLPWPPVRHPALPQSETNLTPLSEFSGHHNSPNFLDFPVGLRIHGGLPSAFFSIVDTARPVDRYTVRREYERIAAEVGYERPQYENDNKARGDCKDALTVTWVASAAQAAGQHGRRGVEEGAQGSKPVALSRTTAARGTRRDTSAVAPLPTTPTRVTDDRLRCARHAL